MALGNAKGGLPARPGGRKRLVSAPARFSRFRPILGSGAHMEGRGEADADGAIQRIGPSQGTGACTGGRSRVLISRHVRWPGPRRVASNGGQARFCASPRPKKRRQATPMPGRRASSGLVRLMTPGERRDARGAPIRLSNMKKKTTSCTDPLGSYAIWITTSGKGGTPPPPPPAPEHQPYMRNGHPEESR